MIAVEEVAEALDGVDVSRLSAEPVVPVVRPVRRGSCGSWQEAFLARTLAVEDGHVEWTGSLNGHGTPLLKVGPVAETAYRYAFRAHHGRDAQGKTVPTCGYLRCVAGGHLEDRVIREARLRAERARPAEDRPGFRPVLTPPDCATWHRGVDLVAVERVAAGVHPTPELSEEEQRYAVVVMTRGGLSADVIAERIGTAERTVTRWREEAGLSDARA
ncbi:helix-turn-helix domain-containing protein [Streptomyces sp. NPDC057020]|uniref:helix-turn-helix domain-containing protein n=1 Tax=unclassified Streptomyces TaxID=2593676 RepID=UPI00363EFB07